MLRGCNHQVYSHIHSGLLSVQYSLTVCIGPVAFSFPGLVTWSQQLAVIVLLNDLPTLGNAICPEAEPKPIESCGVSLMFQVLGEGCAAPQPRELKRLQLIVQAFTCFEDRSGLLSDLQ